MMNRSLDRRPEVLLLPRSMPREAIAGGAPPHDALKRQARSRESITQPHLVIKRGHLGRYRFTLLTDNGRVSGEVKVDNDGASRAEQDAKARAEVQQLAATLAATTDVDPPLG